MGQLASDFVSGLANGNGHLAALQAKVPLTRREVDVLRLMAEGHTTKVIATKLNVTFKTAACHRSRILQKLNVTSTVSAVLWGVREGIIPLYPETRQEISAEAPLG